MKTIKTNLALLLMLLLITCCKKDDPYSYKNTIRFVNEFNSNLGVPNAKVVFFTSKGTGLAGSGVTGGQIWEGTTDAQGYLDVNLKVGEGNRLNADLLESQYYYDNRTIRNLELKNEKKTNAVFPVRPKAWIKYHIKTQTPIDTGDYITFCDETRLLFNCNFVIKGIRGQLDTVLNYCNGGFNTNLCAFRYSNSFTKYEYFVFRNGILTKKTSNVVILKMLDTVTVEIDY
jgi:hypothetical protein